MASETVSPTPPPDLQFPASSATVDVRVIDTGTLLYLTPGLFWQSAKAEFEALDAPVYSFLISSGTRHVLFDLGVRADPTTYAPTVVQRINAKTRVTSTGQDVASVLNSDTSGLGIRSSDIEAIIWSHNHFDHVGDPSRFPGTTELVVGPGVKEVSWPGYPSNAKAAVLDSDAAGRRVREVQFDNTGLNVGGFAAFDFFGDGSFYLLDAPGHTTGHMCGLARTSADPPSFVFMGADACHHPGLLRPSPHLPLPEKSLQTPFLRLPKGPLMQDLTTAEITLGKMQALDASDSVLVILAHDATLADHLPVFPASINDWQTRELQRKTRWLFCKGVHDANLDV